eukprot:gene9697-1906_t
MGCFGGPGAVVPQDQQKSPTPAPFKQRSCTDVIFLMIFLAFWGGMFAIAGIAFSEGNPVRMLNGYDSFGNICGRKNDPVISSNNSGLDMINRPFVFFYNPSNSDALRLCVSSCPTNTTDFDASEYCVSTAPYEFLPGDEATVGETDFNIDANGCPTLSPATNSFGSRITTVFDNSDVLAQVIDDLEDSWHEIIYLSVIAVFISLIAIFFMGCFASIIIWTTYVLAFICCIGVIAYMWYRWHELDQAYNDIPVEERMQSEKDNVDTYFAGSIAVTIVAGILLLLLLVIRSRLALLATIFHEAGRAIRAMPLLLFFPFWTFVFVLLDIAYFVVVYLFLYTTSDVSETDRGHVSFTDKKSLIYMQWYHILGFYWALQLAFAIQEFTVAGAVSKWYFFRDKSSLKWPIFASLKNAFRYHLGSLALGALIIAIIQLLRTILAYIKHKHSLSLHLLSLHIPASLIRSLKLFLPYKMLFIIDVSLNLGLVELYLYLRNWREGQEKQSVLFLNAALAACGVWKKSSTAREAFSILMRNALRVATINSVGTFVLLLSKLVVVAAVAFGALHWLEYRLDIKYPAIPIIIVCVVAWLTASIFVGIYGMTIDTIFLCFAEDSERNDGSPEKPLYASSSLLKVLFSH